MDFDEWMSSGGYLPAPFRDFHDQKRIFQIIGEMVARRQKRDQDHLDPVLSDLPNWIAGHIYVVDFFLWFMARRGWTLQRSRRSFEFVNLDDDLATFEKQRMEIYKAMMEEERARLDKGTPP